VGEKEGGDEWEGRNEERERKEGKLEVGDRELTLYSSTAPPSHCYH